MLHKLACFLFYNNYDFKFVKIFAGFFQVHFTVSFEKEKYDIEIGNYNFLQLS